MDKRSYNKRQVGTEKENLAAESEEDKHRQYPNPLRCDRYQRGCGHAYRECVRFCDDKLSLSMIEKDRIKQEETGTDK